MSKYLAKLKSKYRKGREASIADKEHARKTKKRERKTERGKKSRLTTNQRALIGFLCTLVLLVIGASVMKDVGKVDKSSLADVSRHEKMLSEASSVELMEYATEIDRENTTGNLPLQIDLVEKQLEIGNRIEYLESRNKGSLLSSVKLRRIGLTAKLERLFHENGLGTIDDELRSYVIKQLDSSDPSVSKLANLGVCFSSVSRYLQFPTSENFDEMQDRLELAVAAFDQDPANLRKLMSTLKLVNPNEGATEERKQLYYKLGNSLRQSNNAEIRDLGDEVHDYALISGFDFEDVTIKTYVNDPQAVELGLQFVNQVANGERYSKRAYSLAIYLLEMLERKGNQEQVKQSRNHLISSAEKIDDEFVREKSLSVVNEYVKRSQLPGKTFDFDNIDKELDFSKLSDQPVLIVFYDLTFNSKEVMESIRNLDYLFSERLQLVCVNYEPDESLLLQKDMKSGFTEKDVRGEMEYAIHVSPDHADYFLAICPVKHGPYIVLLNKDHEVEAVNVDADQIRKLVEEKKLLE